VRCRRSRAWRPAPAAGHSSPAPGSCHITPEAVQRFEALEARYPGEDQVQTSLKEARRHRDIDAWSRKAEAAVDGDWDTVVTALENLTGLDPNYSDVAARREQARIAKASSSVADARAWVIENDPDTQDDVALTRLDARRLRDLRERLLQSEEPWWT
jgi:hypothetical protein